MTAQLYLDEDVSPEIARRLRARGIDAVSAHETGTLGVADEDQLVAAQRDGRAIVSFNFRDFLRLGREWRVSGRRHSGIVISFRQYSTRETDDAVDALSNLVEREVDLADGVWVLDVYA